jgi:hypothetical protein
MIEMVYLGVGGDDGTGGFSRVRGQPTPKGYAGSTTEILILRIRMTVLFSCWFEPWDVMANTSDMANA